jgi:hypothetical protein
MGCALKDAVGGKPNSKRLKNNNKANFEIQNCKPFLYK